MLISLIYLSFFGLTGAGLYSFIKPKSLSSCNQMLIEMEMREQEND
ncbi:hypothetical protein PIPA1_09960 [Pelosinus sp. IPA-1]|nr:hypothetical protein PIPA1_09960 [Pelosinus sp. IPA-1]